jgi:hypothetical protein
MLGVIEIEVVRVKMLVVHLDGAYKLVRTTQGPRQE